MTDSEMAAWLNTAQEVVGQGRFDTAAVGCSDTYTGPTFTPITAEAPASITADSDTAPVTNSASAPSIEIKLAGAVVRITIEPIES